MDDFTDFTRMVIVGLAKTRHCNRIFWRGDENVDKSPGANSAVTSSSLLEKAYWATTTLKVHTNIS